jgi:hypothetical protein
MVGNYKNDTTKATPKIRYFSLSIGTIQKRSTVVNTQNCVFFGLGAFFYATTNVGFSGITEKA